MALQVWLPLNGNLDNQGISDATFSIVNTSTVTNTAGKIGNCYYNSSNTTGGLLSNKTINLGQKQSMFCWFKVTNFYSSSALGGGLVSQHRYPSNCGMGISLKYISATTGYLSVNTGNGSSRTYNTYCGTTLLQAGTWYHGGYTYDGTTIKIYVNGVCENTISYTGMSVPADYLTVFCWSFAGTSGTSIYSAYNLYGYINDVRVYDHCLSAKEVKEISKGLVAHYQLKDSSIESTTNLVTGLTAGGRTTVSSDGLSATTNGTSGDTYFRLQLSEALAQNTTYTFSIYGSGMPADTYWTFRFNNQAGFEFNVYNGYNTYTFVASSNMNGVSNPLIDDVGGTARYNVTTFSNCQLEKRDHATPYTTGTRTANTVAWDCSGFKNNGIIVGSLTNSTNTARYSISTLFANTGNAIQIPFNEMLGSAPVDFTISVWIYKENAGTNAHQTIIGGPSGFELEARNGTESTPTIIAYSWGKYTATYEFNKWVLVTFVRTTSDSKIYVNGVYANSGGAGSIPSGNYFIGSWQTAAKQNFEGKMSDFRIYTTALSADDVKELYQASAHIDKSGNTYAYEFVEG